MFRTAIIQCRPIINRRFYSTTDEITKLKNDMEKCTKTLTEEIVEHIITPAGLKTIYTIAPDAADKLKELDTLIVGTTNKITPEATQMLKDVAQSSQNQANQILTNAANGFDKVKINFMETAPTRSWNKNFIFSNKL